jgi:hypothetical protein
MCCCEAWRVRCRSTLVRPLLACESSVGSDASRRLPPPQQSIGVSDALAFAASSSKTFLPLLIDSLSCLRPEHPQAAPPDMPLEFKLELVLPARTLTITVTTITITTITITITIHSRCTHNSLTRFATQLAGSRCVESLAPLRLIHSVASKRTFAFFVLLGVPSCHRVFLCHTAALSAYLHLPTSSDHIMVCRRVQRCCCRRT